MLRLDVPPTLARTLRSTNAIESMISISRDHARNVKRWRDGQMALRWCAAGMVEASKQFRRVNGHLHLPALRTALQRHVARERCRTRLQHSRHQRSLMLTGPPPKFHGIRNLPGTPYRDSYGKSKSPDCGHTYTRQGAYTVRASSHWVITWAGIGQAGTIPMDLTQAALVTIGEAQALKQ